MNPIADFFRQNPVKNKKIVLSLDLDNTLVIRDKGANYINPKIKSLLLELIKEHKAIALPNTGRELIGFTAFQKQALLLKNGVLGSGSIVVYNGHKYFDRKSLISKKILLSLCSLVEKGVVPFIDMSGMFGRKIFYHPRALETADLFFSQNPQEWFSKLPPTLPISKFNTKILNTVFRVEFPTSSENTDLFAGLSDKKIGGMSALSSLAGIKISDLGNYSIKNKLFFNERYINSYVFARFEKKPTFINKSIGLKNWLKKSGLARKGLFIVHIGDKDSGLINDTLIKEAVPAAKIVMVGQKCQLGNPLVDLYLRGPIEDELLLFLEGLRNSLK